MMLRFCVGAHAEQLPGGRGCPGRPVPFYDEQGWTEQDGVAVDQILFGVKEDGPIRKELHQDRIRTAFAQADPDLSLLECLSIAKLSLLGVDQALDEPLLHQQHD